MALLFDHVVLNVSDLKQATRAFEKAGFNVISGGKHGGGLSENALIIFADDTFIELFALTKSWKTAVVRLLLKLKYFKRYQYHKKWGLAYRFYSRAVELKDGIADICFLSDDFKNDQNRIVKSGIFLTKGLTGKRRKKSGQMVKWEMVTPFLNELPFFRSAYEPARDLNEKDTKHPNGSLGISRVTVLALDYKDMCAKYESFLGMEPSTAETEPGHKTVFQVRNTAIEILKSSDFKKHQENVKGKGLGIYGLSFSLDEQSYSEKLDLQTIPQLSVIE